MTPNISIIIPVYNAEKYLSRCLDSCLNQSFENYEIILVNDGSTDSSKDIMDLYLRKDKRISIYYQDNKGANCARELGINMSSGMYIFFLDSDDYIPSNALIYLWKKARENYDIVIGSFVYRCHYGDELILNSSPFGLDKASLLSSALSRDGFAPALWGKLFSSKLFQDIDFVYHLSIAEDVAVICQLLDKSNSVAFIDDVVYCYIKNENSISHKLSDKNRESLIEFCFWLEKYLINKHYFDSFNLRNAFTAFVLSSYFRFLLEGGDDRMYLDFKSNIKLVYLKNKYAVCKVGRIKVMAIRVYLVNKHLGRLLFNLFRNMKNNKK